MRFLVRPILVALLTCLATTAAFAQSGAAAGRVLDKHTRTALPGAAVTVEGTALTAVTDRDGRFHLAGVAPGQTTLIVSYIGRADMRVEVLITAGATADKVVEMDGRGEDASRYEESVVVSAPLLADAQARALNVQKNAPNIANVVSADQ